MKWMRLEKPFAGAGVLKFELTHGPAREDILNVSLFCCRTSPSSRKPVSGSPLRILAGF